MLRENRNEYVDNVISSPAIQQFRYSSVRTCAQVLLYSATLSDVVVKVIFIKKSIYTEKFSRLLHWRRGKHARLSNSSREESKRNLARKV